MKNIYTIITCILLLVSCEDLVEVDYPTDQIGNEQVFEDSRTAMAAMAALYVDIRDGSALSGNFSGTGALLGAYTDDMDCYINDQNGTMDLYLNIQQESNTTVASFWSTSYEQIFCANSLIQGMEDANALLTEERNMIKGEALLLRSILYFYLERIYGDIPYTTSLDYEYNRNLDKTSSSELLDQLVIDLDQAITLLENDYRDAERVYPNKKVAELMLSKIYLTQGNYSEAETLARTILNSPLYNFQTDFFSVFEKSGDHVLWQLKPEQSGDPTREASFYYFMDAAPNNYALTDDLVNSFQPEDLRRQFWIDEVNLGDESWYRPFKYKNYAAGSNSNEYSIVFRLEEVYFILAESLLEQDRTGEALPYINATRERAGLTPLELQSKTDVLEALAAEKRREFFAEFGHRFLDLKRMGRLGRLQSIKANWTETDQLWPIPQSEMLLNPKLVPQNPGY